MQSIYGVSGVSASVGIDGVRLIDSVHVLMSACTVTSCFGYLMLPLGLGPKGHCKNNEVKRLCFNQALSTRFSQQRVQTTVPVQKALHLTFILFPRLRKTS